MVVASVVVGGGEIVVVGGGKCVDGGDADEFRPGKLTARRG